MSPTSCARPTGSPLRQPPLVLVVDDEKNIRDTLGLCLEGDGCQVTLAATREAALEAAAQQTFDLAFLDLRLGDVNGLDLLPELLALQPSLAVVIITAYPGLGSAAEAFGLGAVDYVPKPFTPAEIRRVVNRVVTRQDKGSL